MERWYFDTGIFVTPILKNLDNDVIAACLEWQRRARDGEIVAITTTLTWDEVVYVVGRAEGAYDATKGAEAGGRLLQLPGLELGPVDLEMVRQAQQFVSTHRMKPRDGIHAAAAMALAESRIVTIDSDYDVLGGPGGAGLRINRLSPGGKN